MTAPRHPGGLVVCCLVASCLVVLFASCSRQAAPPPPAARAFHETGRLGEIVCLESDDRIAIDNGRLRLEFDRATGDWVAFLVDGVA